MADIPGLRLTPYPGYKLSWVSNFWGAVQQPRRALRPQFVLTFLPGGGFALPGLQHRYAAAPDYHFLPRRPGARML